VLQHREDDLVLWRGAGISSQDFTFVLGDVIAGGTSAGTAADQSRRSEGKRPLDLFLKIGDVVEVSSPQIGALSNQIVMSESE
jgi:2-keto-4-pentenoate hydratase/2-oxohepta-3-ene-1,7-dioic acid hydratase in catechol pathway